MPVLNIWLFAVAQALVFAGISFAQTWYGFPLTISSAQIVVLTVLALNYRAVFLRS